MGTRARAVDRSRAFDGADAAGEVTGDNVTGDNVDEAGDGQVATRRAVRRRRRKHRKPLEQTDRPVVHMGCVVDPDVADDDIPLEQWSSEPPPRTRPRVSRTVPDMPSLRPYTHDPRPSSEELLNGDQVPVPLPKHGPVQVAPSVLSPRMTAVFGALFGLAGLVAVFAVLHRTTSTTVTATNDPRVRGASTPAAAQTATQTEERTDEDTAAASTAPAAASAQAPLKAQRALSGLVDLEEEGPMLPGPWRVTSLESDPDVRLVQGTVGLDPLVNTLQSKGVSKSETYRILTAFKQFDAIKRPRKNDKFVIAVNRSTGKVVGAELEVGALEIYQAKQNAEGLLVGARLDLQVATRERKTAVRISGKNLAEDLKAGGLLESVNGILDKAFEGRASLASMPENSTLRVILQEKTALGRFAQYDHVLALEYQSSKGDAKPLRLYRFKDSGRYGYFNQEGKEPFRGGWRKPCPGAPISSPFNPKRMHPVLKRIRPHNGTDFAAPVGTPVHATSHGTADFVGMRGAAGNLVILKHPGNMESYYMHMQRFASGLKQGDRVETFQVIGYVGNTGRSTGPHLHFGVKKGDKWIDPMSLKLDGDRMVTASLRSDFDRVKAEFDQQLDAIALPEPVANSEPPPAPPPSDTPHEQAQQPNSQSAPPSRPSRTPDDDELEQDSVDNEPIDDPM